MATTGTRHVRAGYARVEPVEIIRLEGCDTYRFPAAPIRIRILNGCGWLVSQSADHILKAGDEMTIPRQRHDVLISAAGTQWLHFEYVRL